MYIVCSLLFANVGNISSLVIDSGLCLYIWYADQTAPPRLQAVAKQYPPPGVPHLNPPSWYQNDYRAPQGDCCCTVDPCQYE